MLTWTNNEQFFDSLRCTNVSPVGLHHDRKQSSALWLMALDWLPYCTRPYATYWSRRSIKMGTGITLVMLILATRALDSGYLARTAFSYALQAHSSPAPIPDSMTLISNDPSWWPLINSSRIASYFAGSWRALLMMSWPNIFAVLQLLPLPEWRTTGVSKAVLMNNWHSTHGICSTNNWTRGRLMMSPVQRAR